MKIFNIIILLNDDGIIIKTSREQYCDEDAAPWTFLYDNTGIRADLGVVIICEI